MRANWKLLMENTIDIYHLDSTHGRYLRDTSKSPRPEDADPVLSMGTLSVPGNSGNGHVVIEYRKSAAHADEAKRASWKLDSARRRYQVARLYQTLLLFPNTLYIEQRRVIRTCFHDRGRSFRDHGMPLMPAVDDPDVRKQRSISPVVSRRRPRHARRHRGQELIQKNCATLRRKLSGLLARHVARNSRCDRRSADARFWRGWRAVMRNRHERRTA